MVLGYSTSDPEGRLMSSLPSLSSFLVPAIICASLALIALATRLALWCFYSSMSRPAGLWTATTWMLWVFGILTVPFALFAWAIYLVR